jgi:hypothetical protein
MTAPSIPPRQPIEDRFGGWLLRAGEDYFLSSAPQAGTVPVEQRDWIIRYGIVYLGKPHYSIVPALLALDYGQFLTGEQAWHFLLHRSNLYPRADVIGYRSDGTDDMIVVKQLDLMHAFHILAYQHPEDAVPLAQISAIIAPDPSDLPARLQEYATIIPDLAVWTKDTR